MSEDITPEKSESVIALAQKLIRINSEPQHREFEIEQFLWNYLLNLGFYLEKVPYAEKRNNIVAIFPKPEEKIVNHYIAFTGHMDTVPGYKEEDGTIKDGKIFGRGSCDMKGGIAAILTSVESFLAEHKHASEKILKRKKLQRGIVLLFTVDEETGCAGVVSLTKRNTPLTQNLNKEFFIDFGINGEPTSLSPIISHKGVVWFLLDFFGVSAHA